MTSGVDTQPPAIPPFGEKKSSYLSVKKLRLPKKLVALSGYRIFSLNCTQTTNALQWFWKIQVLNIPDGILVNHNFSKVVFFDSGWNIHFFSDPPIYGDLIETKKKKQTKQKKTKKRYIREKKKLMYPNTCTLLFNPLTPRSDC